MSAQNPNDDAMSDASLLDYLSQEDETLNDMDLEDGEILENDSQESEKSESIPLSSSGESEYSEDGDIITLIVGPENNTQYIHFSEHRLIQCSRFFRNALTGGFRETQDKEIRLEHQEPILFDALEMFSFFKFWLNHGRLPDREKGDSGKIIFSGEYILDYWECYQGEDQYADPNHLVDLYLLADKYDIKALRNDCIAVLLHNIQDERAAFPDDEWIYKAFNNLAIESTLCRLLIAMLCRYSAVKDVFEKTDDIDFLRAMCFEIADMISRHAIQDKLVVHVFEFLED